eukprot:9186401-Pyramimonas_sp.AAC.1
MAQTMTQKLGQKQKALERHKSALEEFTQEALEAELKLAMKKEKVAKEEAAIEACISDIARLEEEQKLWLGKARGEQQPKPAAAQVAESFNGLQAALEALGSAAAGDPSLVR